MGVKDEQICRSYYADTNVISLQPYGQCQGGSQGLQIIYRYVSSVALFQPQDAYCPGLGLQVPWVGGAARIDDPDSAIALDTFNMCMSTYNDVSVTAKVVLHRTLNRPMWHLDGIQDIMHHFPEDKAGLEELSERQP